MKIFFISILFCLGIPADAAVEIDNSGNSVGTSTYTKSAADGMDFRQQRRFGIGASASGALGMAGLNMEIVFTPQTSFMGGFGIGDNYQSFALQVKHAIGGRWFVPYVGGGYARWYTVGDKQQNIGKTSPSFLGKRFLSNNEKRTGEFAENLIYPMAGVQYYQLRGNWAGLSLYAQALMLLDLDDIVSAPTGEFGVFYYF